MICKESKSNYIWKLFKICNYWIIATATKKNELFDLESNDNFILNCSRFFQNKNTVIEMHMLKSILVAQDTKKYIKKHV